MSFENLGSFLFDEDYLLNLNYVGLRIIGFKVFYLKLFIDERE